MFSTTFVRFGFVPRKNKSWFWNWSRDQDTYIFHAFRNNFLFCFFALMCWHSFQHSQFSTARDNLTATHKRKMGKHAAGQKTFLAQIKLVHLPSFNIRNFLWTKTSLHTYRHTHSASEQMNTLLLCTFCFHVYIHTYIYVSRTCYFLTSLSYGRTQVHTDIFEQQTLTFAWYSNYKHPHTQISNKHISIFDIFLLTFPSLFCYTKLFFYILIVVEFLLSALFTFFVLLRQAEFYF